jgi:aromatic-L-amino-acid/L-tryptophan decarboxylase
MSAPDAIRPAHPGDLPPEEFRRHGARVIDWIARYLEEVERYPVLAQVRPGQITDALPAAAPEQGEPMDAILDDFERLLLPGVTHWNHPGFFAYFGITGGAPGILAEALIAALNMNGMLWRTGPVVTELEALALDWLRQMMGLPDGLHGHIQDTASISSLVAIAAARERAVPAAREVGLAGTGVRLRQYCSEEAHSSIEKAGITLGLGRQGTRRIPTDTAFRMDAAALDAAIREDLEQGWRPFCVTATVGTTSTTSIDPVRQIADVCRAHGLWLHVDAAYGGAAAVLPEMRQVLDGAEAADSLVVNPHKWLFVPIDCSALFVRDVEAVRRAFSVVPEYLTTPAGEAETTNLMDLGPALGRRFRALKLWTTLRYFGRQGIEARLREHIRLARGFAAWVDAEPGWTRMAEVPFSTVVFRYSPAGLDGEAADLDNERILEAVNASGEVFLSHTRVAGRYALRLAIGNLRTEERHVRRAWELLRKSVPADTRR